MNKNCQELKQAYAEMMEVWASFKSALAIRKDIGRIKRLKEDFQKIYDSLAEVVIFDFKKAFEQLIEGTIEENPLNGNYVRKYREAIKNKIARGAGKQKNFLVYTDTLNFGERQVRSLPNNLWVEGDLHLNNSSLMSLPRRLVVEGNLIMDNLDIKILPNDLVVNSTLFIPPNLADQAEKLRAKGNVKAFTVVPRY